MLDREHWLSLYRAMEEDGRKRLASEGADPGRVDILFAADMRYSRQLHEISVPLKGDQIQRADAEELHAMFDREHERLYGYFLPGHQLDLVNVRVTCIGRLHKPELGHPKREHPDLSRPKGSRRAYIPLRQAFDVVPVYSWSGLGESDFIEGPCIVEMPQTAVVVPDEFRLNSDARGNLLLKPLRQSRTARQS
jgi:N-methylhydantoinase A